MPDPKNKETLAGFGSLDWQRELCELEEKYALGEGLGPHAANHEIGGSDTIIVDFLSTIETNTALVLSPDGLGGLVFQTFLPGSHAATHENGGIDPLTLEDLATSELNPTLLLRPDGVGGVEWVSGGGGADELVKVSANDTTPGYLLGKLTSTGSIIFTEVNDGGDEDLRLDANFGSAAGTVTEGDDSRIPAQSENDALVGTNGTPSTGNPYVTDSDPRNTDARTPTSHATAHQDGGSDELTVETLPTAETDTTLVLQPNGSGGLGWGAIVSTDELVGVSANDTTPGYLLGKLTSTGSITLTEINDGGDEDLRLDANFGSAAGTVTEGDDSRIPIQAENDALVGTNGTPSGANPYVTDSDPRNTDARTPTVHATSHQDGGSDELVIETLPTAETDTTLVLQPDGIGGLGWGAIGGTDELVGVSANDTTPGYLLGKLTSTGSITFTEVNDSGDEDLRLDANFGSAAGTVTEGDDSRIPIQAENDALVGTNGTPSGANPYVTDSDPRNTDARAPLTHAASHQDGGSDELDVTDLSGELADAQKTAVRLNSGVEVSARRRINFIEGAGVGIVVADDVGDSELDVTISAPGVGTDELVGVSANDTTPGYLLGKLTSTGSITFTEVNDGGDEDLRLDANFGTASGTIAEGDDSRIPTQDENDALVGTNGTPSGANPYVTDSDPRNTDARTPLVHATSHQDGGSDELEIETLPTSETDTTFVLKPDGSGGVEFVAASGSVLLFGNNSVAATPTTRYLTPFNDENAVAQTTPTQFRIPRTGTLTNLRITHNTPNGNGNNIVYTLRVNSVASALAATLASTGADASDLASIVAVTAGDLLDVEITKAAGVGTAPNNVVASMEFV